jgi:hypothetical protein
VGGSILVKRGQEHKTVFRQKVVDNRWMNITPFAKESIQRWKQDMQIDVLRDKSHGKIIGFHNYDKDIYAYDMKGIEGISNIVPEFDLLAGYYQDILHRHFQFRYFGTLCDYMKSHGYESKENLFGLPYDPRIILDTNYRLHYFQTIKETIEESIFKNKGRNKPVIVSHSLGGVLLKWFLTEYVSESWIDSHIEKIYILNSPFGGTSMALRVILSGEYYVPMFHQEFKDPLQKMSGIIMCLPNEHAYHPTEALVKIDEMEQVIRLMDFNHHPNIAFEIWRDLYQPQLSTIMKPLSLNIPCDILIGNSKETIQKFKIKKEGELPYYSRFEFGDGQVPKRSLEIARKLFLGKQIQYLEIPDSNHIDIISHPVFIDKITEDCLPKRI